MAIKNVGGIWQKEKGLSISFTIGEYADLTPEELAKLIENGEYFFAFPNRKKETGDKRPDYNLTWITDDPTTETSTEF